MEGFSNTSYEKYVVIDEVRALLIQNYQTIVRELVRIIAEYAHSKLTKKQTFKSITTRLCKTLLVWKL